MIKRIKDGYKYEVENGATHPLGRAALTFGVILMLWVAAIDNPATSNELYVLLAVLTIGLIYLWIHVTMENTK